MQGQRRSRRAASRPLRATLLLISALLVPAVRARSETVPPCEDSDAVAVFSSPRVPRPGAVLRVVAVAERKLAATLVVLDPEGQPVGATNERHGGPPYSWRVEVEPGVPGSYRAILRNASRQTACRTIDVGLAGDGSREGAPGVWPVTREWSRATENLYSAWIEQLFDDPLAAEPAWRGLHEVTRDPERNFLHDHLGLGEDGEHGLRLEPDCADLPYFLRAYFAWKLGLPFGYSECSRGDGGRPPRCGRWHSNLEASPVRGSPARAHAGVPGARGRRHRAVGCRPRPRQGRSDRLLSDETHAGDASPRHRVRRPVRAHARRRAPDAADGQRRRTAPRGRRAARQDRRAQALLARKLPLRARRDARQPRLQALPADRAHGRRAAALSTTTRSEHDPDYGDFDLQQYAVGVEAFYDRVDDMLSPSPLDPTRVLHETIDALEEQVRARVRSVANGEEYVAKHPEVIAMPDGAAIFETEGPWEDYATPSRDLRLLIAIDVVRGVPAEGRTPVRTLRAAPRHPGRPGAQRARSAARARGVVSARRLHAQRRLALEAVAGRRDRGGRRRSRWPTIRTTASRCAGERPRRAPRRRPAAVTRPPSRPSACGQVREWFGNRRRPPR